MMSVFDELTQLLSAFDNANATAGSVAALQGDETDGPTNSDLPGALEAAEIAHRHAADLCAQLRERVTG
jgi:hypothetical protein